MLVLDKDSNVKLYEQIYNQLQEQIISGALQENSRLLSTRNLAKVLQVSRNTVENAYQQLCAEGYIFSKAGSGYTVEKIDSDLFKKGTGEVNQQALQVHEQGVSNSKALNFQYGRLSPPEFPIRIYRKIINQILLSEEITQISAYNDRKGEAQLRNEIMKYIFDSRGVRCEAEQIIICGGIIPCLSIISQLIMKQIRCVAVEEPCYDTVRSFFNNHRFNTVPVSIGTDGIDLEELQDSSAQAVYVTPSHQFPTGVVMPVSKRLELIEWAVTKDAFIIEDDYDSEYRYNSRPIPSMQSLDSKGRVIYINTFSKSFAPGMRISFMVLPLELLAEYTRNFSRYNCSVPWLEQKVMFRFMEEGHWNRHLRKVCNSNKRKHDLLISTISEVLGNQVRIHGKNGGLHILLEVDNGMTEKELIEKAEKAGVVVYPVSNHYADMKKYSNSMVLIGFSGLTELEIVKGIYLLKAAWF